VAEPANLASLQQTKAKRAKHVLYRTWRQHLLEVAVQRNAQCEACWRSQLPAPCLLWLHWQSLQPAEAEQTGKSEALRLCNNPGDRSWRLQHKTLGKAIDPKLRCNSSLLY